MVRQSPALAAWQKARDAELRVIAPIAEHAWRTYGPYLCDFAEIWFSPAKLSQESLEAAVPMFDPWFALNWIPRLIDHESLPDAWPAHTLGVDWLASRANVTDDFGYAFVFAAAESPYSLFLVEAVSPHSTLTLRDLLSGRQLLVVDPEISTRARLDDIVLTAVVTLDGVSTLLGPAAWTMPTDWLREAKHVRADNAKNEEPWLSRQRLLGIETDLFHWFQRAWDRGPCFMLDCHGGTREPMHLEWQTSLPLDETVERLRPLTEHFGGEDALDDETRPDGSRHARLTWCEIGPSGGPYDRRTSAYIYIGEGGMSADVASVVVVGKLTSEIDACLGSAATLTLTRSAAPVRLHTRRSSLFAAAR